VNANVSRGRPSTAAAATAAMIGKAAELAFLRSVRSASVKSATMSEPSSNGEGRKPSPDAAIAPAATSAVTRPGRVRRQRTATQLAVTINTAGHHGPVAGVLGV